MNRSTLSSYILTLILVSSCAYSANAASRGWELRTSKPVQVAMVTPSVKDSPVAFLRNLLNRTEDERANLLKDYPESHQRFWVKKVSEYQAIPQVQRDKRFRATQLHWYLLLCIRLNPSERASRISQIPEIGDRIILEKRLEQWEQLSPSLQEDIITNISVLRYFARMASASPEDRRAWLENIPAEHREVANKKTDAIREYPPARRQEMFQAYLKFFQLPDVEKQKTIARIPLPERTELSKRLRQLSTLPEDLRQRCLDALKTYATMTPDQQQRFQVKAAIWRAMDPSERHVWTNVVTRFPPMPPTRTRRVAPPLPQTVQ